MGRVELGLVLGLLGVLALRVDAALNVVYQSDGEKIDSPFIIGQMLLWRKALIAPASPPKAERPPIPSPSQRNDQQPESQQFVPHVIYDDAANAQGSQPSVPDYYDAVREEDRRMRMSAATAAEPEQHRAHGSLTFTPADHPEHPEATFEPKSIFVDPAANGERVVAAMAPNGHGGFIPLDEVVDSSKPDETHNGPSRVARFSDAPDTGSGFFVVDGETGGSAVPIVQIPTFYAAENGDVRPAVVDGETNVPAEQFLHQIPMNRPVHPSHEVFEPIKTTDYEDQMREKEMAGVKYLLQKRIKPSRDIIPSQEPIEVAHFPLFAVDATTNVKDTTDPRNTAEAQPPWMVPTDDLSSVVSGETPPTEDVTASSTTLPEITPKSDIVDSNISTTRDHKQIDGETSANASTDLPRPIIATRFTDRQ